MLGIFWCWEECHAGDGAVAKVAHWEGNGQIQKIPAVFHAAWQNPQGRFGIVLSNWTKETQIISFTDSRLGKRITGRKTKCVPSSFELRFD